MAAAYSDFEKWLSEKLLSANADIDLEIFVNYITSILDEDTPCEEIEESLSELLSQVVDEGIDNLTHSIIERWKTDQETSGTSLTDNTKTDSISELMSRTQLDSVPVVVTKNLTDEEKAAKAAILNQYAEVADGGDGTQLDDSGGDATNVSGVTQNTNADSITKAEREKREKSKQESAAKKEKDKTDRAAQKQKQQDRKEGEKKRTLKQEKRR